MHGNSGAYLARMLSVAGESAASAMMFCWLAARNECRSVAATVRLDNSAATLARSVATTSLVAAKSFSADRMPGAAVL